MFKPLAAATLGLTLALTPVASAPAQALDRDDAAKILGALAVLGIASSALNDTGRASVTVQRGQHRQFRPHRRAHRALPARCVRHIDSRQGTLRVAGKRCLRRSGIAVRQLPRTCATRIRHNRQHYAAYGLRCLRHNGWRVARHR